MKNKFSNSSLAKRLVILPVIFLLILTMAACGSTKLSGKYEPENPSESDIIFTSMEFDGRTVHVELSGSKIGLDYAIKDGTFTIKENMTLTVDGEPIPMSYSFSQVDNETFILDGITYILVK